jgi:AAA15 family ATPase/GTPase
MKNLLSALFIFGLLLTACSKKESPGFEAEQDLKNHYDTTAVDSFSNGAVTVDIARKIKMSSPEYLDSVKQAKKALEEEQKLKAELEKENKKKEEEEKKTADAEKKKKAAETPPSPVNKTE